MSNAATFALLVLALAALFADVSISSRNQRESELGQRKEIPKSRQITKPLFRRLVA